MRSQVISCSDPWEEQSFYLDSCDPSDQFVWFPRSYLCSFCNREFKSAQALGGHMNVHRRDRAMLKPSSSFDKRDECHHHQPMSRLEKKKTDHDFCSTFVTKSSEIEIVERSGENRWNPCSTSKFDKNQINYPLSSVTPSSTTIHEEGIDGSKLNDSLNDRRQLPSPNFVQKDKKRKRQESKVVYELHINIHEELDLELRLGDRCTVGKILKKINIS